MKKNLTHTHDLLIELVEKLKHSPAEQNYELSDHSSKDFCTIACDKERLFQVFANVTANLTKLNPEGNLKFSTKSNATHAQFLICDEDLLMEDEHIQTVFDKFFHPNKENKSKVKIGLALSRWIIEAHGGKIWLESNKDIGTVVFIELPRTSVEELKALAH